MELMNFCNFLIGRCNECVKFWSIFQTGSKSQGSGVNNYTNGTGTGSQVLGVKSSIRVGNAASNSVESGGGALAHDGAGTSGVTPATSTVNPSVSASPAANQSAHHHPTHKHLLRSRVKLATESSKDVTGALSAGGKTAGKHHKKESTTGTCTSLRYVKKKPRKSKTFILQTRKSQDFPQPGCRENFISFEQCKLSDVSCFSDYLEYKGGDEVIFDN